MGNYIRHVGKPEKMKEMLIRLNPKLTSKMAV